MVRPGDSVLIHAAAGGVGSVAAQIARALGAVTVYGTVGSTGKAEYAKRFGYDAVFLREDFPGAVREATGGRGVDVALDPVSGPTCLASPDVGEDPAGRMKARQTPRPARCPHTVEPRAHGPGASGRDGSWDHSSSEPSYRVMS